jgi:hypothetical protein
MEEDINYTIILLHHCSLAVVWLVVRFVLIIPLFGVA